MPHARHATRRPIRSRTMTAHAYGKPSDLSYDPATLTTDSGVALLKKSVADAARKACDTAADPVTDDDGTCVRKAIRSELRSGDSHHRFRCRTFEEKRRRCRTQGMRHGGRSGHGR